MSLLVCTGFERLLSSADGSNFSLNGATAEGAGGGLVQYQAAARTGGDGAHCIRATANIGMNWQPPLNASTDATVYIKFYMRCTALPTTGNKLSLFYTSDAAASAPGWVLSVLPSGALELQWAPTATVVATSATGLIAADSAWHMVDFAVTFDGTTAANNVASVWLDDTSLFSAVSNGNHTLARSASPRYNSVPASGGGNCDLDDLSIRDSLGSTNNARGGAGEGIALLLPTADSSIGNWTTGAGGTTSLWDAVNNTPPAGAVTGTATSQIKNASKTVPSAYTATLSVTPIPSGATMRGGCAQAWFGSSQNKNVISGSIAFAGGTAVTLASSLSAAVGAWPSGWNADASSLAVTELSGSIPASYTVALTKTTSSTSDLQACQIYAYVLYDHGVSIVNKSASDSGTGNDATTSVTPVTSKSATDSSAVGSESASIVTLLSKSASDSAVGSDSGTFYVGGTVEDTFNRTDSTSAIGTPSDSGDPWIERHGSATTFGINNNAAYIATPSTAQAVTNGKGGFSDLLYRHVGLGNVQDVTFVIFNTSSAWGNLTSSNTARERLYIGYDPNRDDGFVLSWYMYSNPQGSSPSLDVGFFDGSTLGSYGTQPDPLDPSTNAHIDLPNGASTTIRVRCDFRRGIMDVYQDGRWALHMDSSNPGVLNIKFSNHGAYAGWGPYAADETNLPMTYHRLDQFDALAQTVRAALIEPSDAGGNTDSATGSESQTVGVPKTASDSATGADSTTSVSPSPGASDAAAGADSTATIAATVTRTDTGSGGESVSLIATVTHTETAVGTDTASAPSVTLTGSDSATGSEAVLDAGPSTAITDSATGSEAASLIATVTHAETAVGNDATATIAATLTGSDAGTGSEAVLDTGPSSSIQDTATGADSTVSIAAVVSTSDSGSGADTATIIATVTSPDTTTGSDATASIAAAVSQPDSGAGSESVGSRPWASSDSGTGAEIAGLALATSDSGSGVDSGSVAASVAASDTGSGSDAPTGIGISGSDTGSGADLSSIAAVLTSSDAGSGSDVVSQIGLAASDTGTGTDSGSAAPSQQLVTSSDSGSGADTGSIAATLTNTDTATGSEVAGLGVVGSDSGSGADIAAINATVATSDAGTGTESVGGLAQARSDTGTGSEVVAGVALTAPVDTASGVDSASVAAAVTQADSGAGSEAGSIAAALATSDSSAGADATASIAATLTAAETSSGSDSAALAVAQNTSDSATGAEAPVSIGTSGSNTGTGADQAALSAMVAGSDAGAGAEAVALGLSGTEAASGVDSAALAAAPVASDTAAGTDTTGARGLAGSDTGSGSDTSAISSTTSSSDAATGTDVGSIAAAVSRSDSATGSDTAALAAATTASDAASGAEATQVAASVASSDSGTGADSGTLGVPVFGSDSGAGVDLVSLFATVTAQELAVAAEDQALLALLTDVDTAVGSDSYTVVVLPFSVDTGTGADVVNLVAFAALDTAQGFDLVGSAGALKRDIEVFLGDRYVTVTIGEPFLQDIAAGVPFDRIAIGDPVMWNITFAEALDRVAVSERDEVLAVGERLDPITLGTPGL